MLFSYGLGGSKKDDLFFFGNGEDSSAYGVCCAENCVCDFFWIDNPYSSGLNRNCCCFFGLQLFKGCCPFLLWRQYLQRPFCICGLSPQTSHIYFIFLKVPSSLPLNIDLLWDSDNCDLLKFVSMLFC